MIKNQLSSRASISLEPGGWLALRQQKRFANATANRLLELGAALAGNLRFVRTWRGTELCGEVPIDCESCSSEQARQRLQAWSQYQRRPSVSKQSQIIPDDEQIEMALAETGCAFSRREETWIVPTTAGQACEIVIGPTPGGVLVHAPLCDTTPAEQGVNGDTAQAAVAEYLCRAQGGLRFARCEQVGSALRIAAYVDLEFLEGDMRHAVNAVATAGALLLPVIRALYTEPVLARAYLNRVCDQGVRSGVPQATSETS